MRHRVFKSLSYLRKVKRALRNDSKRDKEDVLSNVKVCGAVFGLFFLYILHDILQEKAYRSKNFKFGWLMTTIELFVFTLSAKFFEGASIDKLPHPRVFRHFVVLSVVLAVSQGSGSAALQYVSFPLKVCFKSCKLIPTMLLGVFITGRRYNGMEYVSALLMCLSLILLVNAPQHAISNSVHSSKGLSSSPWLINSTLTVLGAANATTYSSLGLQSQLDHQLLVESKPVVSGSENFVGSKLQSRELKRLPRVPRRGADTEPSYHRAPNKELSEEQSTYHGIFLLIVAISCDALVPNIQERVLSGMRVRAVDMIMWTNMLSGVGTFLYTLVSGELLAALALFAVNPMVLFWLVCQAICGYCGLRCYLFIVRECGAVSAVVATSFRKVATIVLSFLLFSKPFTRGHFLALLLLQAGVWLTIVSRRLKKNLKAKKSRI